MVKLSVKDIQDSILIPLNEVLLLSYGTEVYRQILLDIEKIVRDLEHQHVSNKLWQ